MTPAIGKDKRAARNQTRLTPALKQAQTKREKKKTQWKKHNADHEYRSKQRLK
jgi:hypothetical protein